jgi:hypothetical protein
MELKKLHVTTTEHQSLEANAAKTSRSMSYDIKVTEPSALAKFAPSGWKLQ